MLLESAKPMVLPITSLDLYSKPAERGRIISTVKIQSVISFSIIRFDLFLIIPNTRDVEIIHCVVNGN